jgi:cell division protein FtsN
MALDYSEKRNVPRNRPKKQPVNVFAILVGGGMLCAFLAGLASGWFLGRGSAKKLAASQQPPVAQVEQAQGKSPQGGESGVQTPVLTFYETLAKGNKASVLGTGLNPTHKPESAATPVPPPQPPAVQQQQPEPPKKAPEQPATTQATPPPPAAKKAAVPPAPVAKEGKGKFTVQIASYKDGKEAEAIRARYAEKGLPAYVVQHKDPEKGITWYRVRVGKRLEQKEANDLVSKAGKGAMVVPE